MDQDVSNGVIMMLALLLDQDSSDGVIMMMMTLAAAHGIPPMTLMQMIPAELRPRLLRIVEQQAQQIKGITGPTDCTLKLKMSLVEMVERFDPKIPNHLYKLWEINYIPTILPNHEQYPCSCRLSIEHCSNVSEKHFKQCGHMMAASHAVGRTRMGMEICWCIPTPDVLTYINENSPNGVVSIGAGRGYVERELYGNVIAYDIEPLTEGHVFFNVEKGGPEKLKKHADRTLLLSYAPQKGHAGAGMDAECVEIFQKYGGQNIIFIGERGGDTEEEIASVGTIEFWQTLKKYGYQMVKELPMAQLPHQYTVMCHYKK